MTPHEVSTHRQSLACTRHLPCLLARKCIQATIPLELAGARPLIKEPGKGEGPTYNTVSYSDPIYSGDWDIQSLLRPHKREKRQDTEFPKPRNTFPSCFHRCPRSRPLHFLLPWRILPTHPSSKGNVSGHAEKHHRRPSHATQRGGGGESTTME